MYTNVVLSILALGLSTNYQNVVFPIPAIPHIQENVIFPVLAISIIYQNVVYPIPALPHIQENVVFPVLAIPIKYKNVVYPIPAIPTIFSYACNTYQLPKRSLPYTCNTTHSRKRSFLYSCNTYQSSTRNLPYTCDTNPSRKRSSSIPAVPTIQENYTRNTNHSKNTCKYQQNTKAALKIHNGVNHDGCLLFSKQLPFMKLISKMPKP